MADKDMQDISEESICRKQHFLKVAIQSLVRAGGIATVQADYLRRLLAAMKMNADFTILPGQTAVFMKEDVSPSQGVNVLTFKTGLGYNFDKLEDVEAIICDAMEGRLYGGIDEAVMSLEKIQRRTDPFGSWIHPVGWSLIGFLVTMLLGGTLKDAFAGLVGGLIFGLALLTTSMYAPLAYTFDFWISFIVAALMALIQGTIYDKLNFWPPFLASVILILPGFSMAMGFTDVLSKQTLFGLTNLFNAAWTALSIGMGAYMGYFSIAMTVFAGKNLIPVFPTEMVRGDFQALTRLAIYLPFNVLLNATFQAKPFQCLLIAPIATVGFAFCEQTGFMGDEPSVLLSCLIVAVIGSIYGRVAKRSELPAVLSSVIVFAPGTYGARCAFYAMNGFFSQNADPVLSAKYTGFAFNQGANMLTISASMAVALLLARTMFGRN